MLRATNQGPPIAYTPELPEAVAHYTQYRRMVDHELGLPPSDQFTQLVQPYLNSLRKEPSIRPVWLPAAR